MMSPESECPTDEAPDCDEDEYLTSHVSEEGCEELICMSDEPIDGSVGE